MIQNFNDDMKCENKKITLPEFRASIHNRFDVEVIDSITGEIKQKAIGHNVICDNLWKYLFTSPYNYFNYIFYGEGNGVPSSTDTSLFSYVGNGKVGNGTSTIDYQNGIFSLRKSIQLTAATAAGKTLTEVGIAYSTATTSLCTHAMLKDMDGNLTSINKTDVDVVNIYATIFIHYNPMGYDNGSIYVYKDYFANYDTPSFTDGDFFAWFSGNWASDNYPLYYAEYCKYGGYGLQSASQRGERLKDAARVSLYKNLDVTNKKISITVGRLEASTGNFGGIHTIGLFGRWSYGDAGAYIFPEIIMQPGGNWFPYSIIEKEKIGTGDGSTVDFSLKFNFAKNMKVYIDGIETTDFSLKYGPNNTTNWQCYMEGLHESSTPNKHIRMFYANGTNSDHRMQNPTYFYNPLYEIGINTIEFLKSTVLYASNDLSEWIQVGSATKITIPANYRNYKYWKLVPSSGSYITAMTAPSTYTGKALHFNTAPPAGAVITADYECDVIAKDENNVFDMTVEIQLGEYTEET